jgi:tetratricopeptide (TPR) repeat protein
MNCNSWKTLTFTLILTFIAAACPLRAQDAATWANFQQKAAAWRALPVKPPVSEEVRAARVQAENAFKEKRLKDATTHYEEGLKNDPLWPEGYFNAALIYAELGDYDKAIWHMRAYVELVPDAPDARTGRDQLYVWQDKLKSQDAAGWRDTDTGLLWMKQDNGRDEDDLNQANNYCQNLNLGGYTGWRLPTIAELTTIHDKTKRVNGYYIKGGIKLYSGCITSKDGVNQIYFGRNLGTSCSSWKAHKRILCVRNSGQ